MVTVGIAVMTILRSIVAFPSAFVATTVKSDVPIAVGMPVNAPVPVFKLKPAGSAPLLINHVIGVLPVTMSLWL